MKRKTRGGGRHGDGGTRSGEVILSPQFSSLARQLRSAAPFPAPYDEMVRIVELGDSEAGRSGR
jgi:hypothetical protein